MGRISWTLLSLVFSSLLIPNISHSAEEVQVCETLWRALMLDSPFLPGVEIAHPTALGPFSIQPHSRVKRLGRGEEGEVYRVTESDDSSYLIKIYHHPDAFPRTVAASAALKDIFKDDDPDFQVNEILEARNDPQHPATKSRDVRGYSLEFLFVRATKTGKHDYVQHLARKFNARVKNVEDRLTKLGWNVTYRMDNISSAHPFLSITMKRPDGVFFEIGCDNVIVDPVTEKMTIWDFN